MVSLAINGLQRKRLSLYHHYGLDLPWYQQYWNFLNRLLHFDLGESWLQPGRSVWSIISAQLPASILLGLSAVILALFVGISAGLTAALRANSRYDTAIQGASLFFFALPTFVLIPFYQVAMIMLYNNGIPNLPFSSTDFGFSRPDQMIAPIVIFAIVQIAFWVRITRTSMLEVLRQDYVRTAKAKGISQRAVVWKAYLPQCADPARDRDWSCYRADLTAPSLPSASSTSTALGQRHSSRLCRTTFRCWRGR